MKKLLAICLSVLLICASMPFVFATADEDLQYVRAEVANVEGKAGETVDVAVYVKDHTGLISAVVAVGYNSDVLELVESTDGDFHDGKPGYSYSEELDVNPYTINWAVSDDVDDFSELLATLTFKIKDDAAAGVYALEVIIEDAENFCNAAWDYFEVDTVNGSITVIGDEPEIPECTHEYDDACDSDCNLCGEVRPVHTELTHVAAKDATCEATGNIEYWYCEQCGAAWLDAEGTLSTNLEAVILPKAEHVYVYDCDKYCNECGEKTNPSAKHNMIHVEAKEPVSCIEFGNVEYWHCDYCGNAWLDANGRNQTNKMSVLVAGECISNAAYACQDGECINCGLPCAAEAAHEYAYDCDKACAVCGEITNESAAHNIIAVDAKDATCTENGNLAYWYCDICGHAWLDAECTQSTNLKAVVLPAGHEIVAFEASAPGCHYEGNIAYWFCATCEKYWRDEALTEEINYADVALPAIGGDVEHVAAAAPSCFEDGNIEYWFCAECDQYWQNEELTQITNSKSVILPMAHGELTHVEGVAATCYEDGNLEYWTCEACGYAWLDAEGTLSTNLKAVVLPAGHNIVNVEAVEAGCHYEGNIEYWYCTGCEIFWQDAALTQVTNSKNVIIPAIGGEVVAFEAIEPGCHMNGRIAYWFCPECEQFWQDAALTQLTNFKNVILPATGSENLKHVEYKAPTATENGNMEHWYCPDCEQFWQDEALTQLTNSKNVIIPATGEVEEPDSPVTGDSIVAVLVALLTLVVSGVAVVLLKNKKRA